MSKSFTVAVLSIALAGLASASPIEPSGKRPGEAARALDSLGGANMLRSLDPLGGANMLRSLDPLGGANMLRSLDPLGGGRLLRQLDSLGGGSILRAAPKHQYHKRGFDPMSGMTFGVEKKNFDEIDRAGFGRFVKKNFDEIDRAGFGRFVKKNFDEIDRSGFGSFV